MHENLQNGQMVYLSVSELFPHPDNPRKDNGDLTELAESIKANGVLQNLTVVPRQRDMTDDEYRAACEEYRANPTEESQREVNRHTVQDGYTVIIGHRRLAAAKQAGLEDLPCVIMDMTEKEQIQTMLVENMQRSDLTVYEEAQGFQMMLDLGETVETIAEKAGFSQSTVRRRVKLLDLDKDKFKRAESRGATLEDYAALDKLKDSDAKNQVLDSIGTANFPNELKKAVERQKVQERMAEWLEIIKTFATENPDYSYDKYKYICNYGYWNMANEVKIPDDADKVAYYYKVSERQIDIYCDKDDAREDEERARAEAERRRSEEIRREFEDITDCHFELRQEFVRGLSNTKCKKAIKEISIFATRIFWQMSEGGYSGPKIDLDLCAYCLNINLPKDVDDQLDQGGMELSDIVGFTSAAEASPEKLMFCLAYSAADKSSLGYWTARWENGGYKYGHKDNDQLTTIYELLEVLGYEMSDEETLMRTGCADIFERCGGGEKPAMESTGLEDKSDDDFDAALRDQLKGEIGDDDGV